MKTIYTVLFALLFLSCSDDNNDPIEKDYRAENEQEILAYIAANNLDATRTSTGLYYVIDEIGDGAEITATSDVSLRFRGFFTDGNNVFPDSDEEELSFNLQTAIAGLREGLQYFREGGSGTLLVPAHLAFGPEDSNGVPGGSVIIFDIEVIDYDVENAAEIVAYIAENSLDAVESETGLYYVIDEQGTGAQPNENSTVTVVYKGYFTNNTVFDESDVNGFTFTLNQVIPGWIEGLQYFNEGGSGKLLIPSSLAYGRYGTPTIPGGAVLIFDVALESVN